MPVREALLALLSEEPKHGYQLKSEFEARTGQAWSLNIGQVYTTLDRLARSGLVRAEPATGGDERRKLYALTERGSTELSQWFDSTPELASPPREELLVKVLLAVELPGVDPLEVIGVQRTALVGELQRVRRRQRAAAHDGVGARMMADAQAVRLESEIRWLDLCEERLVQAGRQRERQAR